MLFLGVRENEKFIPKATAFIVSYQYRGFDLLNIVTAEHVIAKLLSDKTPIVGRVNLIDGRAVEFGIADDAFYHYPGDDPLSDVVVCAFMGSLEIEGGTVEVDYHSISIKGTKCMAATPDVLIERRIGIGEEVAVVGLFRSHYGQEKNRPIVRIGNIAAMNEEPVHTSYAGYIDAFLIEARSIGGLSGSPVFISIPPFRVVDGQTIEEEGAQFLLLGLIHGHFDVLNLHEDTVDVAGQGGINSGIGIVIPVEKILETLEQSELKSLWDRKIDEHNARHGAAPDAK